MPTQLCTGLYVSHETTGLLFPPGAFQVGICKKTKQKKKPLESVKNVS